MQRRDRLILYHNAHAGVQWNGSAGGTSMIDDIGVNMQFIQYMGKILIEHIVFLGENKVFAVQLGQRYRVG